MVTGSRRTAQDVTKAWLKRNAPSPKPLFDCLPWEPGKIRRSGQVDLGCRARRCFYFQGEITESNLLIGIYLCGHVDSTNSDVITLY